MKIAAITAGLIFADDSDFGQKLRKNEERAERERVGHGRRQNSNVSTASDGISQTDLSLCPIYFSYLGSISSIRSGSTNFLRWLVRR
jgi:hypothetical protein